MNRSVLTSRIRKYIKIILKTLLITITYKTINKKYFRNP